MTGGDRREYVLGHRQLAAIAFVMVGVMGVAAAMAYMVGRAAAPSITVQAQALPARKTIVVEVPVAKPSPSALTPDPVPLPAIVAPKPVNLPVPSPTLTPSEAAAGAPASGSHYFQVVSTDQAQAEGIASKLTAAGIPAAIGEGPSPDRVRVFAGPVNDAPAQAEMRQKLEALGFRPFLKRF